MFVNQAKNIADDYDNLFSEGNGCRLYTVNQDRRVVLVMEYEPQGINLQHLPEVVENYANNHSADKISVRVPGHIAPTFINQGYRVEASIPGYYLTDEPRLLLARHTSARRALAARGAEEVGYHLEIQYRSGQKSPLTETNPLVEVTSPEQREAALQFYMTHSRLAEDQEIQRLINAGSSIIEIREGNQIIAVGTLLIEGNGRVARVQGLTTANSEAAIAEALISQLWSRAAQKGASLIYSFTSPLDKTINQVLPGLGLSFRGKLGSDTIRNGEYGDRYVWSGCL